MLRPGFEPGSVAREATILDRTILPEPEAEGKVCAWFNKNSVYKKEKGGSLLHVHAARHAAWTARGSAFWFGAGNNVVDA